MDRQTRGEKKISTGGLYKEGDLKEKAQSLMRTCRNWGADVCHQEVSKWKSMEGMRENEGVILSPIDEEVDEICRNCEARKVK